MSLIDSIQAPEKGEMVLAIAWRSMELTTEAAGPGNPGSKTEPMLGHRGRVESLVFGRPITKEPDFNLIFKGLERWQGPKGLGAPCLGPNQY